MTDKYVKIQLSQGRYDICSPRGVQWLLSMDCHLGKAGIFLDDDPGLGDWFGVQDAVYAMRDGYKRTWTRSKTNDLALLDRIMDNLDEFETIRHRELLVKAQKSQAEAYKRVRLMRRIISGLAA